MALTLSSASISSGETIRAAHVTQSVDAFTGAKEYDITISGSLTVIGVTNITGSVGVSNDLDVEGTLTAGELELTNLTVTGLATIANANISAGNFTGSLLGTASYVTGSSVYGPFGSNSVLSASYAVSASHLIGGIIVTPGGNNTEIQFNSASAFAGDSSFTFIYESQSLQQGDDVIASGIFSHAEGEKTQAIGIGSHAEGNTTSTGTGAAYSASAAAGIITLDASYIDVSSNFDIDSYILLYDTFPGGGNAYGKIVKQVSQSYFNSPNTIVELYDTSITTDPVYIYTTNDGGDQTIPGNYSHAEGSNNQAIGDYSHAEGEFTQAIGIGSHAEGSKTQANGNYSHAEGRNTIAGGVASHAEGRETQANGNYSHAEGYQTSASGDYSHAEGIGTIAQYEGSTVVGRYNSSIKRLTSFEVGTGIDDDQRRTSFMVMADSGSIILPFTGSIPTYSGSNGEMFIVSGSGQGGIRMYVYVQGNWRSTILS